MSAKSMFFKLVFVLVGLVGWVIYDRWDDITYNAGKVSHEAQKTARKLLPEEKPPVVQTYKWTDENGQVHYSNVKPQGVADVESGSIDTGRNLMQSVSKYDAPREEKKELSGPAKLFGHLPQAVNQTRELEKQMEQRNREMEQQMEAVR